MKKLESEILGVRFEAIETVRLLLLKLRLDLKTNMHNSCQCAGQVI